MHRLFQIESIRDNQKEWLNQCNLIHHNFKEIYSTSDSTWTYSKYNIFSIASTSILFYNLFHNIKEISRIYINDSRPLWINAWLNYHSFDEVLDWHHHDEQNLAHGYVSIDSKECNTEFVNFTVENQPGVLYIGPCNVEYAHRVVVKKPFDGHRITLAFNIIDDIDKCFISMNNLGAIPI